jgi:valyl-tRNA synthetase
MDSKLNKAVKEAFCRMYEKGLIYRAQRMVNWSCALQTAISSIEVDSLDVDKPTKLTVPGYDKPVEFGVIHSFRYHMKDMPGRSIVVATTRIETMLGDVAVAVHSSDTRYKDLVGKLVKHPFIPDRKMRVVVDDELVDPKFGTGAVKITPAHDEHDMACGQRNKLPFINILDSEGKMNQNCGSYAGMHRYACREKIIKDLEALGDFVGKAPNKMVIGLCSRSKDVIEPVVRPQWWVNVDDMARRSVEAVEKGELKIKPEFHIKTWNKFLKTPQPWCISRQLWWGHRIPAYHISIANYTPTADEEKVAEAGGYVVGSDGDARFWVAARSEEEALAMAMKRFPKVDPKAVSVAQDEDVLDTWFSSGLFPFSTLGWPDKTPDLAKFFPGHLLETGHDILFFWVARMVMMSLELTDKLPFDTVFLHAMVRDKLGKKMSKSVGNVIDPIAVMEGITLQQLLENIQKGNIAPKEQKRAMTAQKKDFPKGIPECGADALRYGLMTYLKQGRSINLDINVVVSW